MANEVSKLSIAGVEYPIKDAQAQQDIVALKKGWELKATHAAETETLSLEVVAKE